VSVLSRILRQPKPPAVLILSVARRTVRSRAQTRFGPLTAIAVSRQDPQALGLLPLDGVVREMKPAVEATNRLLGRLADTLEAERTFRYNSAQELRTPIAGALAQAQLLAASAQDSTLKRPRGGGGADPAALATLAERLLALARAEGLQPLTHEWVDLTRVVRLTADELEAIRTCAAVASCATSARRAWPRISTPSGSRSATSSKMRSWTGPMATRFAWHAAPRAMERAWPSSTTAPVAAQMTFRGSSSASYAAASRAEARARTLDRRRARPPHGRAARAVETRCRHSAMASRPGSYGGPPRAESRTAALLAAESLETIF